ncbi:MAG: DUF4878 domain-containing protein [Mycobacteriaceae bacterium]|nr:DUF4878 domain-containing protein [Mycobacteriaceae bacterium]
MSNPSGPDYDHDAGGAAEKAPAEDQVTRDQTQALGVSDSEPTEALSKPSQPPGDLAATQRRFTAPSNFDAGSTEIIDATAEPATEVFSAPTEPNAVQAGTTRAATPQSIPARPGGGGPTMRKNRSWGWVLALILVIAALAAVAIMGTVWLTQKAAPPASQEDMVRLTIQNFDVAVQKGDLAALRGITCGATRDNYVNYDDRAWEDTHARVAAAKQYPVVASIDQVVMNGDHAEANVTSFMAYAPQTRSTRSFDLQYRGGQWKICQAPG